MSKNNSSEPTRQFLIAMRGTTDKGQPVFANSYFPLQGPTCIEVVEELKKQWCADAASKEIIIPIESITIMSLIQLEA